MNKTFIKTIFGTALSILLSLFVSSFPVFAQQTEGEGNKVTGTVIDKDGSPLVGATVVIEGTRAYVVTNFEGWFSIQAKPTDKLTVSYVGHKPITFTVGNRTNYKLVMEQDESTRLNASVAIGYGTVARKDLTGSVSVVNMDDIRDIPVVTVDQALQGRIAGADIMATTGEPGATTSIRIRGTRSIDADNEPLIVVDGVMDVINDLNDLNPDDIADITVLKDASATAIYGSRGANGVILITTKEAVGPAGKANVTFKMSCGFSQLPKGLDLMSASEYAQYRNDINYFGSDPLYSGGGTSSPLENVVYPDPFSLGEGTDWIKAITRTAFYQKHTLTLSSKTKSSSYYASFSYENNEGIIQNSGQQRIMGRINLITKLFKWLTVGYNGGYTWTRKNNAKTTIGGTSTRNALYLPPTISVTDTYNPYLSSGVIFDNPWYKVNLYTDYADGNAFSNVFKVDINPIKKLVIRSTLSYNIYYYSRFRYYPSTMPTKVEGQGGEAYRQENRNRTINSESTVRYKVDKNGHGAEFMAGFSYYTKKENAFSLSGSGYTDDSMLWNNMNAVQDKETYSAATSYSMKKKMSFFARVNWNYKSRYYLTATARYDGASYFAANHKWAFFPSGAFKWSISNEPFMKSVSWISDLSIRLSAGRTGNDAIGVYRSLAALSSTTSGYVLGGSQPVAFYRSRLDSPDLTWEKTDLYNLGIDWSMLDGKLNITAEGYLSYTSDLLLSVQVSNQTGYSSRLANIGKTSNKGLELTIESKNITRPNFSWRTNFTISHNKQMVENIGTEDFVSCYKGPENSNYMIYGYVKGYPLNSLWGFKYGGVWKTSEELDNNDVSKTFVSVKGQLGEARYYDVNYDGVLGQEDLCYLGHADPDIYGGLQNTFTFFGFKVGIYFAYSLGGKIYNYTEFYTAGSVASNQYRYMLDAWHPERYPDSDIPRAGWKNDAAMPSDFMVHDASFLRLKNISLGYTFNLSQKCKWLRDITLTASGENIYLWKNYNGFDPDVSTESSGSTIRRADLGAYPKARTFLFSIQFRY